jgi:hypothetical protein
VQIFRPKEISALQPARREGLGRPAAKALDVAGHNVERTRHEARLDADDDVDGPRGQTCPHQSGAQLLFRDDTDPGCVKTPTML